MFSTTWLTVPADPLTAVFWATAFTFSMTTVGAAFVLFLKRPTGKAVQSITLGFAAGIMLAAGVWSLLIPAIDSAQKAGTPGWIPAAGGFVLGALFLGLLDKLLPHQHPDSETPEGPATDLDRTTLLALAVTLHNIPEGMSVGLTFAVAALSGDPGTYSAAAALALGIGIQNIPEGTAVALESLRRGHALGARRTRFRTSHGRRRRHHYPLHAVASRLCCGRHVLRRRGRTHPGGAP